ncbi:MULTISPECIES: DUF2786 domain-containing protein [unclassified Streptomyces]|uniref:DUF2786 domain-containing protein n=1 Tax=unclassified Streptomyces TaxID=2593676 RepID=UPI0022534729|nr:MULTISPECIES: DUF2786 domain-containing protein [unclassified Streptomyces]WSP55882.1 DUF2786 domain-containing protein [Streptomyces sp. NBC_01241]WSU23382.1 DUF2786 domain-containing protein [Streptomyces sp. NBC_01108]MCX4787597.1 DUF2786 domain-containing protein [Streptomyces sp. NBC_01221]MCX4796618.1 DUF2786 domain-containing protein [Streptomyces sp. NBC_01242]WSJ37853.1 DUF2786 domain-containing protein [Streptomyces sp. NBC_01321]
MEPVIDQAFSAALYSDGDAGLDAGASLLAADPTADAELVRRGEEFVRRAWARGWQPADLVRIVRRDLDETAAGLVAGLITSETGRYASLPPRWRSQLDGLPVAPPRNRPDRFSYASALLGLYRLLLRLPAIEPVGPPPGTSPHGLHLPPAHDEPRMLTRIRALLAKAEATGFPEEAEALTTKAQELMARHSIDEALLAARTHSKEAPGACRIGVDAPYETAKAILLDAVAAANRCRAVWNSDLGFSTVVGFEPDLDAVELLYTSLLVQGTAAMTKAEAGQRAGGRKRTKTFRQSFLMAYAQRLGSRLAADTARVTAEADTEAGGGSGAGPAGSGSPRLLPVLAARDMAVTDTAERMFPETTTTRVRGATDLDGWTHGTDAADRARMGGSGPELRGGREKR